MITFKNRCEWLKASCMLEGSVDRIIAFVASSTCEKGKLIIKAFYLCYFQTVLQFCSGDTRLALFLENILSR